MKDYERAFLEKAVPVCRSGVDFGDLAREALEGKFGGATEVVLRDLTQEEMGSPILFVKAMSRIFGMGAAGFYEPIVKFIDMGLYTDGGSSPVLDLIRQIGPGEGSGGALRPLHDHRVVDEDGNYSDESN